MLKEAGGKKIVVKNREGSNSLLREERNETEVRSLSETQGKQAVVKKQTGTEVSYCLNVEVGLESDGY